MDWAKAKNILIFVFIILNIFLLVNLSIYYFNGNDINKNIKSTIKILEDRGYTIECAIPNTTERSAMINYGWGNIDRKQVLDKLLGENVISLDNIKKNNSFSKDAKTVTFLEKHIFTYDDYNPQGNIDISNKVKTEKYVRSFIKDLNLNSSEFYLDDYYINPDKSITYAFYEKYKGYLLYNSFITVMISKNGITNIQCGLIKVNNLNYTDTKIIPAYTVLLKNFTDGKNTIIKSIDLGYRGSYTAVSQTEFSENLVWRVKMGDGTVQRFSINNGTKLPDVS